MFAPIISASLRTCHVTNGDLYYDESLYTNDHYFKITVNSVQIHKFQQFCGARDSLHAAMPIKVWVMTQTFTTKALLMGHKDP